MISDENFFLKTKSSLFSLLRIVHINLACQNVLPLPNVKYDWFNVSEMIVTLINPKSQSIQTYCD